MKTTFLSLIFLFIAQISFAQIQQGSRFVGGGFGAYYRNNPTNISNLKDNTLRLRFTPTIGWFISDKLAVGVSLGANWTRIQTPRSSTTSFYPSSTDVDRFVPVVISDINNIDYNSINVSQIGTTTTYSNRVSTSTGYSFTPFIRHFKMFSDRWGVISSFAIGTSYYRLKNYTNSPYGDEVISLGGTRGYGFTSDYVSESLDVFVSYVPRLLFIVNEKLAIEASCISAYVQQDFNKSRGSFKADAFTASVSFSTGLGVGFKYFWARKTPDPVPTEASVLN